MDVTAIDQEERRQYSSTENRQIEETKKDDISISHYSKSFHKKTAKEEKTESQKEEETKSTQENFLSSY